MTKPFHVEVDDKYQFTLDSSELNQLDLLPLAHNQNHILYNHQAYKAEIVSSDFLNKSYQIKIAGKVYQVKVNDALDQLIQEMGFEVGDAQNITHVESPMPGLILEVSVSAGDEVKEGETLLILEAMKMENVISSPRDGVIKSVAVAKGDAIDKKQLLIEFE